MDNSMERWRMLIASFQRLEWIDISIAFGIFLIFLVFRKLFTKYVFKFIVSLTRRTPTHVFTDVLLSFEKPLRLFWIVLGTYLALLYLPFNITTTEFVQHIYRSFIIMLLGWGLHNYMSAHSAFFFRFAKRVELDEDSMLVPFLSKILRFSVIALTIVVIAGEWGYSISGFIAGLGLGGLAFALAAQDTIGNFFGGIIIITEKPFSKGDWIKTPSVEGTVEDITFRSTQIRTFADSIVTVPNSTLANEPITNWSQMTKRQITFKVGVTYSTPRHKLERCVHRIDTLLREHEEVNQDLIMVRFSDFNNSSLDIFVYFFTNTTAWTEWYRIKEDINFKIMNILEEEGVEIAFPSRSLYVEKDHQDVMQEMLKDEVEEDHTAENEKSST
ncbi:mechanosensitive ion channel family protein [Alkalihalophilus marmarensis]|jgi:MscS family membrane protein|uniref:Mechanosensitive ion channel protein n=1 Tax=Alkalihalophilus marmarensis DSM 21297 TaxID=1188261 RepID=U6SMY4_9BACI|nr:mechanosensitive ion channel family protein [Alkalihalophilus marmarensis]ERN52948.1 mechanosensitive ion channel protein [Alkalihalophilus marmarensis DSM 21297]